MANTTFSGPVRSENGFEVIKKSASTGAVTSTMSVKEFTATITVANGQTTGKETSIQIPTNFIPLGIGVVVTVASANAVAHHHAKPDAQHVTGRCCERCCRYPGN